MEVKPAIQSVLVDGEIKLHPKRFENTYAHWLNNIRDWNISRQLWWTANTCLFLWRR
jgi:valyl-tRNA synthetase